MTFNSSCSYAGIANMLAQYGVDTEDREIALAMKLPFLFAREDGAYLAGPMLQSAEWFNLYLNPIGFELTEWEVPAVRAAEYLRGQKTAMLGLRVDESGKHAVVCTGCRGAALLFLNNKWENTDAPETFAFTEPQLLSRLDQTAVIATLSPIPPRAVDLCGRMEDSVSVLRQNLADIEAVCGREESVSLLRQKLNPLFRPLLLDGITMLRLIGETDLADTFTALQSRFLSALRADANQTIKLGSYLPLDELSAAVDRYIQLIRRELTLLDSPFPEEYNGANT